MTVEQLGVPGDPAWRSIAFASNAGASPYSSPRAGGSRRSAHRVSDRDTESREWLCTNGIGGFASGTVPGVLTRRYHGLLVAALKPPLGRTLLVAKVDEQVEYAGLIRPLLANRWGDGTVDPSGFGDLQEFRLDGTTPVWTYA